MSLQDFEGILKLYPAGLAEWKRILAIFYIFAL